MPLTLNERHEVPLAPPAPDGEDGWMESRVDQLAMKIFTQMAAQYTVRHGLHGIHTQAASLVRESFNLAEAYMQERHIRTSRDKNRQ